MGTLFDERRLSALQIRVTVLCALTVLLDGFDIQVMALAVPALSAEWAADASKFGLALAGTLIGMAFGSLVVAPLGDRHGRRPLLIASLALVGIATLGTSTSTQVEHLVLWRVLTGVGLGASLPNATALTSEYLPARRRAALVTLMYCNAAVGGILAGFVAPLLIEAFGWRSIFVVGGSLPLLLAAVLMIAAPESLRFLLERKPGDPRIARLMGTVAPHVDAHTLPPAAQVVQRASLRTLLSSTYLPRTLLLWCVYCLNLFTLFLIISWLPTLLRDAGWPSGDALRGAVVPHMGGIGAGLLLAWLIDRGRTVPSMVSAYVITAVAFGGFTIIASSSAGWWLLLLALGAGTSGTQYALTALAAAFYPTAIRATGIGWSFGVGRIGAILGPLVGGALLKLEVGPVEMLLLLAIPMLVCAGTVLLLPRALKQRKDSTTGQTSSVAVVSDDA